MDEERTESLYEDDYSYPDDDRDDYEENDYEEDSDHLLAQQELEDFEQADEYFNHYDYNDE